MNDILLLLDLGCGTHKRTDGNWIGVDAINFKNVDVVSNVLDFLKTLSDNTVDGINASHFLEHLESKDRILLFNECCRVLKQKSKMYVESPHWTCPSAYGDPTHVWPPLNEWSFYYLNKKWRDVCAPHCGYNCNFDLLIKKIENKIITIYVELTKV